MVRPSRPATRSVPRSMPQPSSVSRRGSRPRRRSRSVRSSSPRSSRSGPPCSRPTRWPSAPGVRSSGSIPPVALVAFADTVLEEFVKPLYGVAFLAAALLVVFADGLARVQGWGPVWSSARQGVAGSAGRGARRLALDRARRGLPVADRGPRLRFQGARRLRVAGRWPGGDRSVRVGPQRADPRDARRSFPREDVSARIRQARVAS